MLRTWLKKHWLPLLLLAAFLYLAIGATAPFFHYKTIPHKTKEQFSTKAFYQDGPGVDRAMILETNESATKSTSFSMPNSRSDLSCSLR